MPDVLGSTVYKAATQSSRPSSGSLPVTGGEAAAMALVALVALGSGLVLVRFSRRKGRRPEQS
jgi:LPXTG-motif cell wall-anchored protein